MSKVKVDLKDRSYEVLIGTSILGQVNAFIGKLKPSKIIVITDSNVNSLYGTILKRAIKHKQVSQIYVPAGEKFKNLYTASAIYNQLVDSGIHRDSLIIAFGGGVVCDLAGFIAATYMRGISLINIPTTLLAQVDAAIGGKTGVDHADGKNLIGSFYQPKLVLADTQFLVSLPSRELKTGLAEVVKYGIIKDHVIFQMLEKNPKTDKKFWEEIISRSAKIKAWVVSNDEYEKKGLRMILNLGHTFGHAIETLTGYQKYTHGEAVALGIVIASILSNKLKLLKSADLIRIVNLIKALKLPATTDLSASKIIELMSMDKKVKGGKITLVLPISIGKVVIKNNISIASIKNALKIVGCK